MGNPGTFALARFPSLRLNSRGGEMPPPLHNAYTGRQYWHYEPSATASGGQGGIRASAGVVLSNPSNAAHRMRDSHAGVRSRSVVPPGAAAISILGDFAAYAGCATVRGMSPAWHHGGGFIYSDSE